MMPQGGAPVTPVDKSGNVIGSSDSPSTVTARNTQGAAPATRGFANSVIKAKDAGDVDALIETIARLFNGTTFDPATKPNLFGRVASSAASGNPANLKASSGDVMQFWGQCAATAAYLQLYNKATAPVIGTDTPILTFPIPANSVFSQSIPQGGAYFPVGISYAFTTDAAGTTGSAASAVTAFAILAA